MPIVSISLPEQLLAELEAFEARAGYKGRSDVIRTAVRSFLHEEQRWEHKKGKITLLLVVVHAERAGGLVEKITHAYTEIIKTRVHNCLPNHECLELFMLEGNAQSIQAMAQKLKTAKTVAYVKMLPA